MDKRHTGPLSLSDSPLYKVRLRQGDGEIFRPNRSIKPDSKISLILDEFHIKEKVVVITMDNATNMDEESSPGQTSPQRKSNASELTAIYCQSCRSWKPTSQDSLLCHCQEEGLG
ncbi:hypothetical protein N1851_028669 [Merluccius polli]|uniref:Uncharacterized protein n=1 Tax=Merluccius polli TaxID=89951 RepID=A0AA47M884_MERPO|nr:hypothetical protein N1851_028669 [Merluccius polli]